MIPDGIVLSLFAGAGGESVACQRLRLAEVGIEWDDAACATRRAAGHVTVQADVSQLDPAVFAGARGIFATPPCPSFSTAGKRQGIKDIPRILGHIAACRDGWVAYGPEPWHDDRSRLVLEVVRWASVLRPVWIACEQVPPVLPVWVAICQVLRGWGYSAWCGLLSAECYGVPQTRERAILMARRDGRPAVPPAPTHQAYRPGEPRWTEPRVDLFGNTVRPWVSMADALGWGMEERPFLTYAPGAPSEHNRHNGGPDIVGGSGARAVIQRERERAWRHRRDDAR